MFFFFFKANVFCFFLPEKEKKHMFFVFDLVFNMFLSHFHAMLLDGVFFGWKKHTCFTCFVRLFVSLPAFPD